MKRYLWFTLGIILNAMDAFNAVYSTTFEMDEKYGTDYNDRFKKFLEMVQDEDLVVDGAMTDPKGDRGKAPHDDVYPPDDYQCCDY